MMDTGRMILAAMLAMVGVIGTKTAAVVSTRWTRLARARGHLAPRQGCHTGERTSAQIHAHRHEEARASQLEPSAHPRAQGWPGGVARRAGLAARPLWKVMPHGPRARGHTLQARP